MSTVHTSDRQSQEQSLVERARRILFYSPVDRASVRAILELQKTYNLRCADVQLPDDCLEQLSGLTDDVLYQHLAAALQSESDADIFRYMQPQQIVYHALVTAASIKKTMNGKVGNV
jgi:hypothetical protein